MTDRDLEREHKALQRVVQRDHIHFTRIRNALSTGYGLAMKSAILEELDEATQFRDANLYNVLDDLIRDAVKQTTLSAGREPSQPEIPPRVSAPSGPCSPNSDGTTTYCDAHHKLWEQCMDDFRRAMEVLQR
jgi:hypothetical protein